MDSENPGRLIIIDYQRPNYDGASVGDERRERVVPGIDGALIKLTVEPPPGTEAFLPLRGEDGRRRRVFNSTVNRDLARTLLADEPAQLLVRLVGEQETDSDASRAPRRTASRASRVSRAAPRGAPDLETKIGRAPQGRRRAPDARTPPGTDPRRRPRRTRSVAQRRAPRARAGPREWVAPRAARARWSRATGAGARGPTGTIRGSPGPALSTARRRLIVSHGRRYRGFLRFSRFQVPRSTKAS